MRPESATAGPTGVTRSFTPVPPIGPDRFAQPDDYRVEIHDRIGAVEPAEWDAAVRAGGLPVFYAHRFLAAYERYPLAAIDAFRYLVLRRRGAPGPPAAVLPAYLPRQPDPLSCLAPAYPLAAGQPALLSPSWHCYDGHLGGRDTGPGLAAAAVSALRGLARDLGVGWCGVVNVRHGGPTAAALTAAGLPLLPLSERYAADLRGVSDLEDLQLRGARPRARVNLRRNRRRAYENDVRSAVLPVGEADLAGVAALCDQLANRYGTDRFYPVGTFERFLAELGPCAQVLEVRQHGRLIAAGVCLLDEHSFHSWAGGADYEVDGNFSPYYVMFGESVELALRLGLPTFEGGRGNPDFKLRQGLSARRLDACLVPS